MDELIPYSVISSLMSRLASEAFLEFGRIYGVVDELERLKKTVESVRAVLLDAEDKQEQRLLFNSEEKQQRRHSVFFNTEDKQQQRDFGLQNLIRRLKDNVLLPADDLLDEFLIEYMRHKMDESHKNKATKVLHSLSPNRIAFRRKLAHKIEKIIKLNYMVEHIPLSKNAVVVEQSNNLRRETCAFVLESSYIVGRENDKKDIINLLRQPHGDQNISVVAIVGRGGLGKTTLAQLVFNDAEVKNIFEKRMWICVPKNFNVKTIMRKILKSLINSKLDNKLSLDNLKNMLRDSLIGKRYLLVLDDVWNESYEKWTQLWTYLMCGAHDSKILVTTRSIQATKIMGVSFPYYLDTLTDEESWSLLKNITAYDDEAKGVNQTLKSIVKKLTKKCDGLPLAIRILGGVLQGKTEKLLGSYLLRDLSNLHEEGDNIIMSMLKLSYVNLSPQLRQCFAYCSLYPKGWQIEKDELIQLWMAQGYLEFSGEHDFMEDIGNQFVMTLLKKSFFQDAKLDDNGDVHSFKMNDLTHDLAILVAGSDCCYLDSEAIILEPHPIHVSLEPNAVPLLNRLIGSRLRTLILLSSDEEEELNWDELFVISKFKYLRALKLSYSSLSKLSGSIGKLKHLRYLNLSHCRGLGSLCKSISIIVLLQTLIMTPDEKVEFSTMAISKLMNLRHLHISDWEALEDKNPAEFGKLSLQQFKGMAYSNQSSLPRRYKGMIFSNWLFPLSNIVEISLFLCGSFRYLPPLERHPFLKSLHISYLEELEYIHYEEPLLHEKFFPSLESLTFWFCGKLKGWLRLLHDSNHPNSSFYLSLPPFPRLSQLSIIGCQMLTKMPTFPNLESRLELFDSSVKTFEATLNMVASECPNDSPPLSMLKSLHIDGMALDLKKIPKDWMQNLTSLQDLQINWFTCEIFQEISVWFKDSHNCLPSLQRLAFHNCEDLEALPDWICNLSLLTHLSMYDCINLASLPEGMFRLSNLQTLEITGCPIIIEECETQTSEVWTKIAHIPEIILK